MQDATPTADNPYALFGDTVEQAQPDVRLAFVRKTYFHLAAAIYAFAALEWFYFSSGLAEQFVPWFLSIPYSMLIMLGAFIGVGWIADSWARSDTSPSLQYAGLMLYVVFESIIILPLLWFANMQTISIKGMDPNTVTAWEVGVIPAAAFTTLVLFGALTAIPWLTGKDFSFLGAALGILSVGAFALIAASFFIDMHLGVWFTVAMIVLAAMYILYDTSQVMKHYKPTQHVAASLALFASVALMFWYVLQLFMSFSDD